MGADNRRREPTFAEIAAAARKTTGHPFDGRHPNRILQDGAWDAEGRYWERQRGWLTRENVERLLASAVLVVLQDMDGTRWYSRRDGLALWRGRLAGQFVGGDESAFVVETVYRAERWSRPDDSHLVWFYEHC